MQYGELVTRSFSIVWRWKYLWLLAILGGADVTTGGFGGNFSGFGGGSGSGGAPSGTGSAGPAASDASQQVSQFLQDYLGLIVLVGALLVVLALAWLVLSCITTGALVRGSAEHDAGRPFGPGAAWRAGLGTFWSIVGLRLVGLLLTLLAAALIGVLVVLGIASYAGNQQGALAAVVAVGVLVGLALVIAAILFGIAFILATRAIVLERRGPLAALGRAFQLLRTHLGRVLLVWLLQVALGLGASVAILIVLVPVVLVVAAPVAAAAVTGGAGAAVLVAIPLAVVCLALIVVLAGVAGAYLSTYWTLAFRRMELPTPAPAPWPPAAYPPQQPAG
jgi:hypothetical protein